MFLRAEEQASSSGASSDEESKDVSNLMMERAEGMLIMSKYPPLDRYTHRDTTDESGHKGEASEAKIEIRQTRSGTHPKPLEVNVVESIVLDAIRPNGSATSNNRESKFELCKQSESVFSKSCLDTVKESLLSETKKRKDLEYSLELKDRMIKQLKLQNQLYEKIGGKSMQTLHSPMSERCRTSDLRMRKATNKQREKQKKVEKEKQMKIHTTIIKEIRSHRQFEHIHKRPTERIQQQGDILQMQRQIAKHKKLIKTFGQTLSKQARKQVARDGKESKDLRQLWDTWNRLLKDLGS